MEDWKVGDGVVITYHNDTQKIDRIAEITKGGNIRLEHYKDLFNQFGRLRGAGTWNQTHIQKISEEEYSQIIKRRNLKSKIDTIIHLLSQIDLVANEDKINKIYDLINEE